MCGLPPISADLAALVREADVVALPLMPQTKYIINAERIAAMGNIQFSVANGRDANQCRAKALI
jgi:lactate dehydrogenase-like 2-hydroxyacid dehydrogenase